MVLKSLQCEGVVNYVNRSQGYGWIRCLPKEKQFGCDVLITDLEDLRMGDRVQFEMQRHPDTKQPEAKRIIVKPRNHKTVAELMGEPLRSDPHADRDAAIETLKQKRDLRSIGVPLYQPPPRPAAPATSPLPSTFLSPEPVDFDRARYHPPPPPSSTAGADAVAADPAVAALVPALGSPCLQPKAANPGQDILNSLRMNLSPPMRPMIGGHYSGQDDLPGGPPPPPPGDGPTNGPDLRPPPPPPPRGGAGPAVLQRGQVPPWAHQQGEGHRGSQHFLGQLQSSPRSPPPPPPEAGRHGGDATRTGLLSGPSHLLRQMEPPGPPPPPGDSRSLEDEWREGSDPKAEVGGGASRSGGASRTSKRHEGMIIRAGKDFGFIECKDFGEPVYVDRKHLPTMAQKMRVSFRAVVSPKGVAAADVQVEAAPEEEEKESAGPALTYEGVVKKIHPEKQYGFVVCESTEWDGDVFISKKLVENLKIGDRVIFAVKVRKDRKAEAVKLERGSLEEEVAEDAPVMVGIIKSFEEAQGYGFIRSSEATTAYNRDVFLHRKQLKKFKAGDTVQFRVKLNREGHPQAFKLQETDQVVSASELEAPTAAEPKEKETFIGEIKSFSPINGFGFIRSPELKEKYGRDVFLHESQFEGLKIGDRVSFVLQVKDGKPQALEVKRLSKKSLTSPVAAPAPEPPAPPSDEPLQVTEPEEPALNNPDPAEQEKQSRKLLRACASERPSSIEDILAALEAGAEVNARDVTGQTAIMISALNMRGADRKCKLLLEHRADLQVTSDSESTQSTLEWVKERINPSFAAYLEALSKGEAAGLEVTLDAPMPDEF